MYRNFLHQLLRIFLYAKREYAAMQESRKTRAAGWMRSWPAVVVVASVVVGAMLVGTGGGTRRRRFTYMQIADADADVECEGIRRIRTSIYYFSYRESGMRMRNGKCK